MKQSILAVALVLSLSSDILQAAALPQFPLPPSPTWCTSTPIAVGQIKGLTLGPCPIPPPAAGCPAVVQTPYGPRNLLRTASISYGVYPAQRANVDISTWDGLWGYNSVTGPVTPWPGVGGAAPVIRVFPKNSYICAKFRTPANISAYNGGFTNPSYVNGPNVTMSISKSAGDFDRYLPTPGCVKANVATSDANLVLWKGTTNAPAYFCNLQPNTNYYVNIMFHNPTTCGGITCALGTVSVHN